MRGVIIVALISAAGMACAGDEGELRLSVLVGDRVEIELDPSQVIYEVENVDGQDIFADTDLRARFTVLGNTRYRIIVNFPSWQPPLPAFQGAKQPAFSDGEYLIGGQLFLDPTPDSDPSDLIYSTPNGRLTAIGTPDSPKWGIGANVSAKFTNNPAGLAAPGNYTLDAEITVLSR